MPANARRLVELGMVPPLAKEVKAQIENGGLQIGTTSGTAMAGNRTPTATIRGGVLQQTTIAALTGTVGTANDAMTAVPAATQASTDTSAASLTSTNAAITSLNNNLADLQAKVNAILAANIAAGVIASS